jgi:creatinine amidohydrolase/Fe(II)-dependent formamide hydrolase-like protein
MRNCRTWSKFSTPLRGMAWNTLCESLMLALKPDLVDISKAVKECPKKPKLYGKSPISFGYLTKAVYGDATKATKEKGK